MFQIFTDSQNFTLRSLRLKVTFVSKVRLSRVSGEPTQNIARVRDW
jgi:hypothetical protein